MGAMKRSRRSSSNPVACAVARHAAGFNCAQAVFSSFCRGTGVPAPIALGIASPLGAGMGRLAGTCGAVTGAALVIGIRHGHRTAADQAQKEKAYAMTRDLVDRFRRRNGSIICRTLLGHDISTPKGFAAARRKKLFSRRCTKFVRDAAQILTIMERRHAR